MTERFSVVTTDGIRLDIESGGQANKDCRQADNRAEEADGGLGHTALFRKITNPRSSSRSAVRLAPGDRALLEQLARSRVEPHRHVVRSHIVLMAHTGSSVARIAAQLGVARSTVRRWCRRCATHGVQALFK